MTAEPSTATLVAGPRAAKKFAVPTQRKGRRDRDDRRAANWFVLPVILVVAILTIVPLGFSVVWSFTDFNGFNPDFSFVGFANYATIFSDPTLLSGLGFTVLFAAATTILITVIAIPLALILNQKFFGRSFARSLFFFLGVPSLAILGLVWRYILSPLESGVVNSVLKVLGAGPVPWLGDPALARMSVILIAVWAAVGWHATLYLAYLQSVPAELHEQATVDGANAWQKFRAITLPHLTSAIGVSTFLLITGGLKVYELPFTLTNGGPGYATETVTSQIILRGVAQSDYGVGSALAILFTFAVLVIVFIQMGLVRLISRRFE